MTSHPPSGGPPRSRPDHGEGPFGLPVLHELPELASAMRALLDADRAIARAVDLLIRLRACGAVEATTGVGPDGWLSIVARRTGADRRMLLTVVDTLARLPHLHRCFSEGALSWAQLRSIVLQVHRLTSLDQEALDTALTGAVGDTASLEPDVLTRQVRWIVDDLLVDHPPAESTPEPVEFLSLQPRLDGSGGTVHGELSPVGLAALDAATRPPNGAGEPGRRRAEALTDLCLHATTVRTESVAAEGPAPAGGGADDGAGPRGPRAARRSDVQLLLRVELETLLGHDRRPAQLLTALAGGAMWTDAATARILARDARSLRLIVTERGAPVGVGRRSYEAPRWLRETLLALHDTCTAPGCTRPALTADVDHAQEWSAGGLTDVANLAPLCAHHNRAVARRTWRIDQEADGTRRWTHPRSGLTTTTRPDRPPRPTTQAPEGRTPTPSSPVGPPGAGPPVDGAPPGGGPPGGSGPLPASDAPTEDSPPRPPHPAGPDSRRGRPPPTSRAA